MAADLIKSLLVLDPAKRLGTNGAQEIKQHKFFEGIDWENIRKQTAPIIPEQKHETDTDNFGRMKDKFNEKDKESPFATVAGDHKANQRIVRFVCVFRITHKFIASCKRAIGSNIGEIFII